MSDPSDTSEGGGQERDRVLRQAAHMGVLSGLYPGVVHDLKSPLNALVVNLELLKSSISEQPDVVRQGRYVEILHEELMRLNRSIERLLPAAAPASDERGRFDLRSLLDEVVSLVSTSARHQSVNLEVVAANGAVPVDGHRDRLKQALLCVVSNALEAMPRGGTLGLELEVRADCALLSVADTGVGIPEEAGPRIYDLYFSTKERRDGLGLYVARTVVESTNGSIRHSTLPEGGCRFTFTLPLAA